MTKLTLWQYDISPFSDKVRRAAFYKGLDYDVREVLISETGKLKHISPTGKFPVLETNGQYIVDSTDILAFFEELQPEPSLTPAAPRDAALATILEDWSDESLYFYDLSMRAWPQNMDWFLDDLLRHEPKGWKNWLFRKLIPSQLPKAGKQQGIGRKTQATITKDITSLFTAISALLDGKEWLVGDSLSHADLAVRSMTYVINRAIEGRAALDTLADVRAWEARVDGLTLAEPADNERPTPA
ncbi:MAG: glutathione S-transferase family protein [Pseudomonadota bacterium]